MKKSKRLAIILCCIPWLSSCILPIQPQVNPDEIYTSAAQTIAATMTLGAHLNAIQATAIYLETQAFPITTPEGVSSPAAQQPEVAPQDQATPTYTLTPQALITPTPSRPMIHSTVNTNCRKGPGSIWDIISGLMVGQSVPVLGRISAATWYLIQDPDDATGSCWVWSKTTVIDGDMNAIPVVESPPTPTPSLPVFDIEGSADPATYTGVCPVEIQLSGSINSDKETEVTYKWTSNFGKTFSEKELNFKKAGTKSFAETVTITEDTDGYFRIRIYEPYEQKSEKITIKVNCN